MFLDIEILHNSFSLPGAKAAFIFCVHICVLEAQAGGAQHRSVGERSLVEARVMLGLFSHLWEAIIRFLVFAFRQIKI